MPNKKGQTVIAVDGTSASGKSTLSERLAQDAGAIRLEYSLVFRAIALHMLEKGFDPDQQQAPGKTQQQKAAAYAEHIGQMSWDEFVRTVKDHPDLRHIRTSRTAPYFSGLPEVLEHTDSAFVHLINISPQPVVAEGRTIGRYVYPEADVKFFVDATLYKRAERRHRDLQSKGREEPFEVVLTDLAKRDHQDQTRDCQPTGFDPAQQWWLDTTTQTIEETLAEAKAHINQALQAQSQNPLFLNGPNGR